LVAAVRKAGAVNRTLLQVLARLRMTYDGFTAIRNLSPSSRRRPGPSLVSSESGIAAGAIIAKATQGAFAPLRSV